MSCILFLLSPQVGHCDRRLLEATLQLCRSSQNDMGPSNRCLSLVITPFLRSVNKNGCLTSNYDVQKTPRHLHTIRRLVNCRAPPLNGLNSERTGKTLEVICQSGGGGCEFTRRAIPVNALGIHSLVCMLASVSKPLDDRLGSQYTGDTLNYIENGRGKLTRYMTSCILDLSSW